MHTLSATRRGSVRRKRRPADVSPATARRFLCAALLFAVFATPAVPARAAGCLPGIADNDPAHCRFFVQYNVPGEVKPDGRLTSRLVGDPPTPHPVRSYALVIGIDEYPNFEPKDRFLAPARNDVDRFLPFLKEQGFDEIILLHNADATAANINYFLDVYLNRQLDLFGPDTRVLVAHTGHGAPGGTAQHPLPGSIVLSDAYDGHDYAHMYPLQSLAPKLQALGNKSFHFVALLGSCFSGGVFPQGGPVGSNDNYPRAQGAHAVSSTLDNDFAYGLGPDQGSIFFDSLVAGIRNGEADPLYAGWAAGPNGDLHRIGGGIVRLGALVAYISGKIDQLGINPQTKKPFPQILLGRLAGDERGGAFFFLGPPKTDHIAINNNGAVRQVALRDSGSAVLGSSDVKVFSPPDSYRIAGIDVSHWNGAVNWAAAARAGIRFSYMKATESVTLKDETFSRNWAGSAAAGVRHGAYHVFDFCLPVEQQFQNLSRTIPADRTALPIALDLLWLDGPSNPQQRACGDVAQTRQRLLQLAKLITGHYGKPAVFFGSVPALNDLMTDDFLPYPIWLQRYEAGDADPRNLLKLKGRNPWSLWQYTSRGQVPGIHGRVDRDVFFGDEATLDAFIEGQPNPALSAVSPQRALNP